MGLMKQTGIEIEDIVDKLGFKQVLFKLDEIAQAGKGETLCEIMRGLNVCEIQNRDYLDEIACEINGNAKKGKTKTKGILDRLKDLGLTSRDYLDAVDDYEDTGYHLDYSEEEGIFFLCSADDPLGVFKLPAKLQCEIVRNPSAIMMFLKKGSLDHYTKLVNGGKILIEMIKK